MGLSDPDSLSFINNTVLVAPSNHINNTMDSNAGYLDNDEAASLATKPWPLLRQSLLMVVILSFAYVVVFFLSIVNNSLVVMVIYRNPQLRTITNIFIANLAVADILVSILVLPITLLGNLFEGRWRHSLFVTHLPRGCSSLGCARFLEFLEFSTELKETESSGTTESEVWIGNLSLRQEKLQSTNSTKSGTH